VKTCPRKFAKKTHLLYNTQKFQLQSETNVNIQIPETTFGVYFEFRTVRIETKNTLTQISIFKRHGKYFQDDHNFTDTKVLHWLL
jgi:hypothetical protein